MHSFEFLVEALIFIVLELALLLFLVDLSQQVAFTVSHLFNCALLLFNIPLSFLSSLYPRLKFKVLLFEVAKLLHQLIFLLNKLFEVIAQLCRLRLRDAELGLEFSDALLKLGALKVGLRGIFIDLLLRLAVALDLGFEWSQFEQLTLLCGTVTLALEQFVLLKREFFA